MPQDEIWNCYTAVSDCLLRGMEADEGDAVSALSRDADRIRELGDRLESLVREWHSLHNPVKLPSMWAAVPSDIVALAEDHNAWVSKVEEAFQGGSLTLDSLAKLLGGKAQSDRVARKIADMEGAVKEVRELLLTLYRDAPKEVSRLRTGSAAGLPSSGESVIDALEQSVAGEGTSFLERAKAEALSLQELKALLSESAARSSAAITGAERKLQELRQAGESDRRPKAEEKKTRAPGNSAKKGPKETAPVQTQATPWFYLDEANQAQQTDSESLTRMIKDQSLSPQSLVWCEGWAEWRALAQVEEFVGLFQSTRPATPPPLPGGAAVHDAAAQSPQTRVFGGIKFIWCPPGRFLMGCPKDELGSGENSTQHQVTLTRGLWLGKFPVTQRQWELAIGHNRSQFKSSGPDAPVEQVSWYDACEFCRLLSQKDGLEYRLPTEAEWEYACRAGSTRAWGFLNEDYADEDIIEKDSIDYDETLVTYAWFEDNSDGKTHPVGQKKPNAWGFHDMHGNVDEWCQDYYEGDYPRGAATDPTGPLSGSKRVFRGGAWDSNYEYNRSASRWGNDPDCRLSSQGFRVAVSSTP